MKISAPFPGILLAAITLAVGAALAPAQTYNITDLGTINTDPQTSVVSSHARGINKAGRVTGYSYSGTCSLRNLPPVADAVRSR